MPSEPDNEVRTLPRGRLGGDNHLRRLQLERMPLGGPIDMSRIKVSFGVLVAAQSAHSIEEYLGRLWQSFPPAAFLTGLISSDHELGFVVINCAIVAFGIWCLFWPVRKSWVSAPAIMWFWIPETRNSELT